MSVSRKTTFISILLLTSVSVFTTLMLQKGFPILESEQTLGSNLSFLALININIIAVMILAFVVVRNVVRLVIDRRKNILGAKLRSRLVFAFVFLAMVPTFLLFLVAQGMIEGVLTDWFSPKIESALESSRSIANEFYDFWEKDTLDIHQRKLSKFRELISSNQHNQVEKVNHILHTEESADFFILNDKRDILYATVKADGSLSNPPLRLDKLQRSVFLKELGNQTSILLDNSVKGEFLRIETVLQDKQGSIFYFDTIRFSNQKLSNSIKDLLLASDDYSAFKSYQRPLSSSYFLTLVVITLLIIFAAISVAFFLSRGLSVPIGLLAKGTEQIANGNLNYHIPELGDDELSVLVKGFNKMTSDLKSTSHELVTRTRYIEAILSSLEVGVFSVNNEGVIKTFNEAGLKILNLGGAKDLIDMPYNQVLPSDFVNAIDEINQRNLRGRNQVVSKNIDYQLINSTRHLTVTLSRLIEEGSQGDVGLVILVDDVTELERAQRMAAWQEVAKRIAHEIKNPLTPIQLSAERITKIRDRAQFSNNISNSDITIVSEATEVIISQVQNLRTLVNEFSNFARMPKSELAPGNLNVVVKTVTDTFRTAHPDVSIKINLDNDIPEILLDKHQFERVLINLLDNSITAMKSANQVNSELIVSTTWDANYRFVALEIIDNGPGVSAKDKQRIFEPYFTKKSDGTGLGLAIVKSVVSDHNGFIRAFDNPNGKGLGIRIELPVI